MFRVKLVAELNQLVEEDEVVPHAVQLISPPFLGRTVLTAGPAKFGMDLSKQEHGVRGCTPSGVICVQMITASLCCGKTLHLLLLVCR